MKNILDTVNKDSVIVACKKRAKEILKNHPDKQITLMKCLDLAAKEMKFSHWYELRTSRKNNVKIDKLTEKVNPTHMWESLLNKYFKQDYDTVHFEVRDNLVEIKARKYGLIESMTEDYNANMIKEVLNYLNIEVENYGWLSTKNYNIQTMPVYSSYKEKNNYYDVVVVKKDEFEVQKNTKKEKANTNTNKKNIAAPQENTFVEKLKLLGFNENNIQDIKERFGNKNIFIAGVTGSGKSKTAEIIINGLKEKNFKVISIEEVGNNVEMLEKTMLEAIKSGANYIYVPEARHENMVSWLNKVIQKGCHVITTIHANSIDNIYTRLKSLGFKEFDYKDSMTNNLFIYQEMIALLCSECKEEEFSFKKIVKNTDFMNYINKYEKHEKAEYSMKKRSNSTICKNPKCHHGLEGRKIIAETYNVYEDKNNNYYKNIENHNRYINYDSLTIEEKIRVSPSTRLREGKIVEYLKNMSLDCQSNKFAMVLKGDVEL